MRISDECHGCLQRLAVQASSNGTEDQSLREEARKKAEELLHEKLQPGSMSIVVASAMHDIIRKVTGNPDPYRLTKDIEIEESRTLFGLVKDSYREDFQDYLKLAALGNAIDFFKPIEGVKKEITENKLSFVIDDSAFLEGKVKKSGLILYLADNAGGGILRYSVVGPDEEICQGCLCGQGITSAKRYYPGGNQPGGTR